MKYFAKYLPVEGQIKEGDKVTGYKGDVESERMAGFMNAVDTGDFKKLKLFLCSRDIQVDDKVEVPLLTDTRQANANNLKFFKECKGYKVIGEISPDALTYVKEGDEFDEYKIGYWGTHGAEIDTLQFGTQGYIQYCKIKGPCKHFH